MIFFTDRLKAGKLFERWAEQNNAAKTAINVIGWLESCIDEKKLREFLEAEERKVKNER